MIKNVALQLGIYYSVQNPVLLKDGDLVLIGCNYFSFELLRAKSISKEKRISIKTIGKDIKETEYIFTEKDTVTIGREKSSEYITKNMKKHKKDRKK